MVFNAIALLLLTNCNASRFTYKGKERKDISISKDILVEKQVLRPDV
jgi:hypothetical protein